MYLTASQGVWSSSNQTGARALQDFRERVIPTTNDAIKQVSQQAAIIFAIFTLQITVQPCCTFLSFCSMKLNSLQIPNGEQLTQAFKLRWNSGMFWSPALAVISSSKLPCKTIASPDYLPMYQCILVYARGGLRLRPPMPVLNLFHSAAETVYYRIGFDSDGLTTAKMATKLSKLSGFSTWVKEKSLQQASGGHQRDFLDIGQSYDVMYSSALLYYYQTFLYLQH